VISMWTDARLTFCHIILTMAGSTSTLHTSMAGWRSREEEEEGGADVRFKEGEGGQKKRTSAW
jgi:hypothetical protein